MQCLNYKPQILISSILAKLFSEYYLQILSSEKPKSQKGGLVIL